MSIADKLSRMERVALGLLQRQTSILVSNLEETTTRDFFGEEQPGLDIFAKLERRGLCIRTEEELLCSENPSLGTFTPSIEITPEGQRFDLSNKACASTRRRPRT